MSATVAPTAASRVSRGRRNARPEPAAASARTANAPAAAAVTSVIAREIPKKPPVSPVYRPLDRGREGAAAEPSAGQVRKRAVRGRLGEDTRAGTPYVAC